MQAVPAAGGCESLPPSCRPPDFPPSLPASSLPARWPGYLASGTRTGRPACCFRLRGIGVADNRCACTSLGTRFWPGGSATVTWRSARTSRSILAKYAKRTALSVVMPMIFLLLGRIGLPGGAVYINRGAYQGKWRHSFVSGIGPLVNLVLALALIAVISRNGTGTAPRRWALPRPRTSAWCFTRTSGPRYPSWRSSQVTAAIFNLLPVPGLDGFGIWEPWLPGEYSAAAAKVGPFGYYHCDGASLDPPGQPGSSSTASSTSPARLASRATTFDLGRYLFQFLVYLAVPPARPRAQAADPGAGSLPHGCPPGPRPSRTEHGPRRPPPYLSRRGPQLPRPAEAGMPAVARKP